VKQLPLTVWQTEVFFYYYELHCIHAQPSPPRPRFTFHRVTSFESQIPSFESQKPSFCVWCWFTEFTLLECLHVCCHLRTLNSGYATASLYHTNVVFPWEIYFSLFTLFCINYRDVVLGTCTCTRAPFQSTCTCTWGSGTCRHVASTVFSNVLTIGLCLWLSAKPEEVQKATYCRTINTELTCTCTCDLSTCTCTCSFSTCNISKW